MRGGLLGDIVISAAWLAAWIALWIYDWRIALPLQLAFGVIAAIRRDRAHRHN